MIYINRFIEYMYPNKKDKLININNNIEDNTCLCIKDKEKYRDYILNFEDYKLEKNNSDYSICLCVNDDNKVLETNYYINNKTQSFYIESINSYKFSKDSGKLYLILYNKNNIESSINFLYKINNHINSNNDVICIIRPTVKIYIYLTRNNLCDDFYIDKIIYSKI